MRILWFSRTPSRATERMTKKLGIGNGWIESLEEHISQRENIELGVAFPWRTDSILEFEQEGTQYFAIPVPKAKKAPAIISSRIGGLQKEGALEHQLEIIEKFQPDVILVFGTEKNFGLIAGRVKTPVLIWIQGNFTVYSHMWFKGFSKSDVRKYSPLKPRLYGYSHIDKYLNAENIAKREREILKNAEYVLGRTSWDKRIMSLLAPNAKYFHCDEVLRDVFYKTQWKPTRNHQKLTILTTIQDNLYKGIEMIFGCAKILSSILGDQFEWRIAGVSQQHDLLKIVQGKLKCNANEINVVPLGRIPAPDLIQELLGASIYVHTSHIDNSPNAVCEAMIIGMPVVATNTGGVPDLLENKKEGLLVQPSDIYAMAGAILEMHRNYDQAIEYGQNARKRALKRHDPQRIVEDLINIFHRITSTPMNSLNGSEKMVKTERIEH